MTTNRDTNFDPLAERFAKRIYGDRKGSLRLQTLWRDMLENIPAISTGTLNIWDAGGGMGQISQNLADLGHQVLLSDLSSNMLDYCEDKPNIQKRCDSIQSIAAEKPQFDLIVCHAVLEWVTDFNDIITNLSNCLSPGGKLSLMFYNHNALIINDLIKGNYNKLLSDDFAGQQGGLTPHSPRDPDEIIASLEQAGLNVESKRGIRLAYDLLRKDQKPLRSDKAILEMEWKYGKQNVFWPMARYVHFVCSK